MMAWLVSREFSEPEVTLSQSSTAAAQCAQEMKREYIHETHVKLSEACKLSGCGRILAGALAINKVPV